MTNASQLRKQIEMSVADKIPISATPFIREIRQLLTSDISEMDEALKGGVPCGAITELVGKECTGRTSMALAYLAAATQNGNSCGWIDVVDSLDPESAAAIGVELEHLLWVRCGREPIKALHEKVYDLPVRSTKIEHAGSTLRHACGGSPYPHSEGISMPQAVSALLRPDDRQHDPHHRREIRCVGTPGAPNRHITICSEDRKEQVNSDRLPARRGKNLMIVPRYVEPQRKNTDPLRQNKSRSHGIRDPLICAESPCPTSKSWKTLDQALRTIDLLLQNGGFRIIVLDLGGIAPEIVWRIPLATWFRFRATCSRTLTSLIVLTQHSCASSSAELVVVMEPGHMKVDHNVMAGVRYSAEIQQNRTRMDLTGSIRNSSQSQGTGQWNSRASWMQS